MKHIAFEPMIKKAILYIFILLLMSVSQGKPIETERAKLEKDSKDILDIYSNIEKIDSIRIGNLYVPEIKNNTVNVFESNLNNLFRGNSTEIQSVQKNKRSGDYKKTLNRGDCFTVRRRSPIYYCFETLDNPHMRYGTIARSCIIRPTDHPFFASQNDEVSSYKFYYDDQVTGLDLETGKLTYEINQYKREVRVTYIPLRLKELGTGKPRFLDSGRGSCQFVLKSRILNVTGFPFTSNYKGEREIYRSKGSVAAMTEVFTFEQLEGRKLQVVEDLDVIGSIRSVGLPVTGWGGWVSPDPNFLYVNTKFMHYSNQLELKKYYSPCTTKVLSCDDLTNIKYTKENNTISLENISNYDFFKSWVWTRNGVLLEGATNQKSIVICRGGVYKLLLKKHGDKALVCSKSIYVNSFIIEPFYTLTKCANGNFNNIEISIKERYRSSRSRFIVTFPNINVRWGSYPLTTTLNVANDFTFSIDIAISNERTAAYKFFIDAVLNLDDLPCEENLKRGVLVKGILRKKEGFESRYYCEDYYNLPLSNKGIRYVNINNSTTGKSQKFTVGTDTFIRLSPPLIENNKRNQLSITVNFDCNKDQCLNNTMGCSEVHNIWIQNYKSVKTKLIEQPKEDPYRLENVLDIKANNFSNSFDIGASPEKIKYSGNTKKLYDLGLINNYYPASTFDFIGERKRAEITSSLGQLTTDGVYYSPYAQNQNDYSIRIIDPTALSSIPQDYRITNTNTQISGGGHLLENVNALGIYATTLRGYNDNRVTAIAVNAKKDEVGFTSFETEDNGNIFHFKENKSPVLIPVLEVEANAVMVNKSVEELQQFIGQTTCYNNRRYIVKCVASVFVDKSGLNLPVSIIVLDQVIPTVRNSSFSVFANVDIPAQLFRGFSSADYDYLLSLFYPDLIFKYPYEKKHILSRPLGDAHSGKRSLEVRDEISSEMSQINFIKDKLYYVSFWAKSKEEIEIDFFDIISPIGDDIQFIDKKVEKLNTNWSRYEYYFKSTKDMNNQAGPKKYHSLVFRNAINGNSIVVYNIDDIRIHPANSKMQSFVYDTYTYRTLTELDDNNYGKYYGYDSKGQVISVQVETEQGRNTVKEEFFYTPSSQ